MTHTRKAFCLAVLIGVACLVLALSLPSIALGQTLTPVYRFYNVQTGIHFYTASPAERDLVLAKWPAIFTYEGVAYNVDSSMATPLYRFYNVATGGHFYTASEAEKATVIAKWPTIFTYEGVAYNVSLAAAGHAPVFRFYNTKTGAHFYTASDFERAAVIANYPQFMFEGVAFYVVAPAVPGPDVTPPVTLSDAAIEYRGSAVVRLSASDIGSGVAHTYYILDGGLKIEGTSISVATLGDHTIEFWSVDVAGNVEAHKTAIFAVVSVHANPGVLVPECTVCHAADLLTLHKSVCADCHALNVTPTYLCTTCHNFTPATHPNLIIAHSATGACVAAGCHQADVSLIHAPGPGCDACHGATALLPAPSKVCEDCHNGVLLPEPTHPVLGATVHRVAGPCYNSTCHVTFGQNLVSDAALIHSSWAKNPGCAACHFKSTPPSLTCFLTACHGAGGATLESLHAHEHSMTPTCESCHSSATIAHENVPSTMGGGCFCHLTTGAGAFHFEDMKRTGGDWIDLGTTCQACHEGAHAAHSFTNGVFNGEGWVAASGHNTTIYGIIGALTKWDGTEGVLITDSADNTIVQEWPLPTSGVFWSDSVQIPDPAHPGQSLNPTDTPAVAMSFRGGTDMAAKIRTDVGWGSVIVCEDCHTNLDASMGPQGANAGQVGLDPNFPDDWTKAEITSFDPTGMRSIETKWESPNPFYGSATQPHQVLGSQINMGPDPIVAKKYFTDTGTTTINVGEFYNIGVKSGSGYSSGVVTGRYICQKCHKLTNSFQGLGIEGNGRGYRSNNMNYMGFANEAHMEHHADMITGQANCVSCHIAIPHGWKRPRLLVYESDPAPYKVQWVFPQYQNLTAAKDPNADLSQGNWGYLGGNSTASSTYKLIGAAIPDGTADGSNGLDDAGAVVNNTGKTYSSHLERIAATDSALKELVIGPAALFAQFDATNGTRWGLWNVTKLGSEWLPDTSPNALFAGEAIQNNCTACTSAGLTHSDTGGTSEGVAETAVPGRHQSTLEEADPPTGNWMQIPYWR